MLQYITVISNNEEFCCYVGLHNLLKSRSIYQPTERRVTKGSAQCSLTMRAGVPSYMEDYEETSKMLQQRLFDRQ